MTGKILFLLVCISMTMGFLTKAQAAGPVSPDQQSLAMKNHEDDWRFAAGGGVGLRTTEAKFADGSASGISFSADYNYAAPVSLAVEARKISRDSWGFTGGLNYEFERSFKGGTITIGDTTYTLSGSSTSKIQFTTLYANAVYRWDIFYIPFGFNTSMVKFTPTSTFNGTSDASGGLGAQLGAGWEIDDTFAIELYSWVTAAKLSTNSGGVTSDYGTGTFGTMVLTGKYIF